MLNHHRPTRRALVAGLTAALLVLGTVTTALAAGRATGTLEYHGDAVISGWVVHQVQVTTPGPVALALTWDDPNAQLKAFLRPPSSNTAVRSSSTSSPIVIGHDATQIGTWTVAVKTVSGTTPYTLTIEVEGSDAPLPPLPTVRQPYDTPVSSWQTLGRVRAIVPLGDQLWLGGHFRAIAAAGTKTTDTDTLVREHLAVLDAATGTPLPITPAFDDKVWAMASSSDGSVMYVGGSFKNVDGVPRARLAAIDTATGALLPWNPGANSVVRSLTLSGDGSRVIAGGQFTSIDSQPQKYLAAIDPTTGRVQADFAPVVRQTSGTCPPRCTPNIDSLALGAGDTLYFGGHFGLVNGQERNNGGAVALSDPTTALPWAPDVFTPDPNNPNQKNLIASIAVPPAGSPYDDRVIVCGDWYRVAGVASPNVEAVDAVTGAPVPGWTASTDGGTPACVADATTVYIGGHFTRAGGAVAKTDGQDRRHIAALDLADGTLLPWNPGANSTLGLHRMVLHGDRLYMGGDFTRVTNRLQRGVATFLLRPPPAAAQEPTPAP